MNTSFSIQICESEHPTVLVSLSFLQTPGLLFSFFFPPTKLLFLCRQSSDDTMSLEIRKFTQWPLLSELNLGQRTNWTNLAIQPNVITPTEIFVDVYWRHTNVLQNLPTKDLKKLWPDKLNKTTRAPGLLPLKLTPGNCPDVTQRRMRLQPFFILKRDVVSNPAVLI